jgi:ribonuclease Y
MGLQTMLAVSLSDPATIGVLIVSLLLGVGITYGISKMVSRSRLQTARDQAQQLINEAKEEATRTTKDAQIRAKEEALKRKEEFDKETNTVRTELKENERRLAKREDNLEKKLDALTSQERSLRNQEQRLADREQQLNKKNEEVDDLIRQERDHLLRISGMGIEEAKDLLLSRLEREVEHEAAAMIENTINNAKENAESKARDVIITAIQRYAAEHTSDHTVSAVDIPSDDMKGRVIGREGRNIRAFEKATGVDVIVDDTPGVVVVSAFDPVRREVARLSLERLIQDGRIHPARIEELVAQTRQEVEKQIVELGKKASMEANVGGLHRKQIDLLGRLHYRTSYGQNVLRHSIEVAFLCQVMAEELGLDGAIARRAGLLHDIGKAVDHEVEGGHPQIGADICKRFDERNEVLNAIAGHHGDVPAISPYTPLVSAADAISASRPGSRRESLERYIKRLEALEEIANQFQGVKQSYAIQAGREVRVIVDANKLDDKMAAKIARDIAQRVEQEMTYPGEVKVTVLREVRAVEYAR